MSTPTPVPTATAPVAQQWVLTIDQACKAAQVSRNRLYKEIHAGRLRIMKNGRRTLISEWAMREWLQTLEQGAKVDSASVADATAASVSRRFGVSA